MCSFKEYNTSLTSKGNGFGGWVIVNHMVIQIKEEKDEEKIKYEVCSFRLHRGTKKLLFDERKKSGLSWNRFIYRLLKLEKK